MTHSTKAIWHENTGTAIYNITYKGQTFTGIASCHTDDEDMKSEKTGLYIAELRAMIKYLKFIKNCELETRLAALKQLYYSINCSKQFNRNSYEARMLYRQIKNYTEDIEAIKDEIVITQRRLEDYINAKQKTYEVLRRIRQKYN